MSRIKEMFGIDPPNDDEMPMRICNCGEEFEPKKKFHRLCNDCAFETFFVSTQSRRLSGTFIDFMGMASDSWGLGWQEVPNFGVIEGEDDFD